MAKAAATNLSNCLAILAVFAINISGSTADPDPLQDVCVAGSRHHPPPSSKTNVYDEDPTSKTAGGYVFPGHGSTDATHMAASNATTNGTLTGVVCTDPRLLSAADFTFQGLNKAGNTHNTLGSSVTAVNAKTFPGLNTLGISFARIDFAKNGLNPPHVHPRATEVLFLLEGDLSVGFIAGDNKLFSHNLTTGDLFVFPKGLIHFQQNIGNKNAISISAFNSQNPGVQQIVEAVFASHPSLPDELLELAFGLNKEAIRSIEIDLKSLSI
ncbi:hypothetical protein O6H91_17G027800 [Diphasiastrum complanatum]|uniref:Uncharacterized protein n=1 Tax=Diphasiastrum complanatum TaxID=34168 RepID=A0ACC2B5A9_DIPCM|nr:hypothetical protein O6H91_Y156100 [Diphasiastrum complanatum]KAJ7524920.1 hypothetical protein O6H91_17G027800 [Diphasiastrum complanatum]